MGGNKSFQCDIRVIAATHRNLEESIDLGDFREDLFYRLNVFPIEMPSLRERPEDIEALLDFLFYKIQEAGRKVPYLTEKAIMALQHYSWPGNVRELGNLVERLSILFPALTVEFEDLPRKYQVELPENASLIKRVCLPENAENVLSVKGGGEILCNRQESMVSEEVVVEPTSVLAMRPADLKDGIDLKSYLVDMEVQLIQQALSQTEGNVSQAAKLLQTNRTTLVEKIRKYDLT